MFLDPLRVDTFFYPRHCGTLSYGESTPWWPYIYLTHLLQNQTIIKTKDDRRLCRSFPGGLSYICECRTIQKFSHPQQLRQKCSTPSGGMRVRARQTLPDTAAQTGDHACKFSLPSVTQTFTSRTGIAFPFSLPHSAVVLKIKISETSRGGRRFNTVA